MPGEAMRRVWLRANRLEAVLLHAREDEERPGDPMEGLRSRARGGNTARRSIRSRGLGVKGARGRESAGPRGRSRAAAKIGASTQRL